MPRLAPVRQQELVRRLRRLGFAGPFAGGKHPHMRKGDLTIIVPNPHRAEIGVDLLARLLKEAGITRDEWERSK